MLMLRLLEAGRVVLRRRRVLLAADATGIVGVAAGTYRWLSYLTIPHCQLGNRHLPGL
jgi:hypothetical protein